MAFIRKPPTVFKAKHKQRNGKYSYDSYFSFKIMHQGKVIYKKMQFTKQREAQAYVNKIFSSEESLKEFIDEHFCKTEKKTKNPETKPNKLLNILESYGWLNWETNPKMIDHKMQGKNYGSRHTKNLTFALRNLFVETKDYEWFSSKDITSISRSDAQKLSSQLWNARTCYGQRCEGSSEFQDKFGNYKINIVALKTFFTYCTDTLGLIEFNPFQRIQIPKSKIGKGKSFFEKFQLQKMFDMDFLASLSSDKEWKSFLASDFFKSYFFIALTGLRSGEVRALKWKQIETDVIVHINRAFKNNTTQETDVGSPKWDKIRTIYLCDSAHRIIKDNANKGVEEYVFKNSVGKAIDSSTWTKKFKYFISVLKDNFILLDENYTPHSYRGTLNSLLLLEGHVSESLIQKYLGWSINNPLTAVQEMHYTRFTEKDLMKVAEAIELMFSGKSLMYEYITKEEKNKYIAITYNWKYSKHLIESNTHLDSPERLEILRTHKNYIFKKINNHILEDKELYEEERLQLIDHCKKVIKKDISITEDLDVAFPPYFKKYVRNLIADDKHPSIELSLGTLLRVFAFDFKNSMIKE